MMIESVIFDMDGVILDSEKIYFRFWKQTLEEFGYHLTDPQVLALRSCSAAFAQPYLQQMLGDSVDYYALRKRRRQLVYDYMDTHEVALKPGLEVLLQALQEKQIPYAIATATPLEQAKLRLQQLGLHEKFPRVVGGDSVEQGKPRPDIYLEAAKQLGIPAEHCLAIEDSPNGIYAAVGAGCKVIMVPDLTQPEPCFRQLLYGVADTLADVVKYL